MDKLHDPSHDSLLFLAKGDKLDRKGLVVIESTAIEETAFNLLCIKQQGDDFPFTHSVMKYFIVPSKEGMD